MDSHLKHSLSTVSTYIAHARRLSSNLGLAPLVNCRTIKSYSGGSVCHIKRSVNWTPQRLINQPFPAVCTHWIILLPTPTKPSCTPQKRGFAWLFLISEVRIGKGSQIRVNVQVNIWPLARRWMLCILKCYNKLYFNYARSEYQRWIVYSLYLSNNGYW